MCSPRAHPSHSHDELTRLFSNSAPERMSDDVNKQVIQTQPPHCQPRDRGIVKGRSALNSFAFASPFSPDHRHARGITQGVHTPSLSLSLCLTAFSFVNKLAFCPHICTPKESRERENQNKGKFSPDRNSLSPPTTHPHRRAIRLLWVDHWHYTLVEIDLKVSQTV